MASYNGLVTTLIKGTSNAGEFAVLDGVSQSVTVPIFPSKGLAQSLYVLTVQGVSGTISAHLIGAVGGATFVIAGQTGITADATILWGSTSAASAPLMRPAYVEWASGEDGSGFTGSVFVSGEY